MAKKSVTEKIADVVDKVIHPSEHAAASEGAAEESSEPKVKATTDNQKPGQAFKGHPKFDKFSK